MSGRRCLALILLSSPLLASAVRGKPFSVLYSAATGATPAFEARLGGGARRLQKSSPGWPTEHANTLNTGVAAYDGPAEVAGICVASFFEDAIGSTTQFFATGVTSSSSSGIAADSANFFGGTDNVLRIVNTKFLNSNATTVNEWACSLSALNKQSPTGSFGLVSSPETWTTPSGWDRVAVASMDGFVYALDWRACAAVAASNAFCNYTSFTVPSVSALDTTAAASPFHGDVSADPIPSKCLAWNFSVPGRSLAAGFSFQSPPRFLKYTNVAGSPNGILLVADTAVATMTGGVLHAINPDSGKLLWSYPAVMNGQSYGLVGISPAWDGTASSPIYLAFGTGVVAIDPATGKAVGNFSDTGDVVVASAVLAAVSGSPASAVFLHTTLGTVWRLNPFGSIETGITLTPVWKCDYTLPSFYGGGQKGCTTIATIDFLTASAESVGLPLTGSVLGQEPTYAPITRGDASVSGGWPQTTTASQRDALHAAVRMRYAAAFPDRVTLNDVGIFISSPPLVRPEMLYGAPDTPEALAILEVALMAAALPADSTAALYTGVDWSSSEDPVVASYARLDGAGLPPSLSTTGGSGTGAYVSSYPYSTPALGGNKLAVSQFSAVAGPSLGLFVADITTGTVR